METVKEVRANPTNDMNRNSILPRDSWDARAQSAVPHLLLSLLGLVLGTTVAVGGDNPVPTSLPEARYAEMSVRSPFAVAETIAPETLAAALALVPEPEILS